MGILPCCWLLVRKTRSRSSSSSSSSSSSGGGGGSGYLLFRLLISDPICVLTPVSCVTTTDLAELDGGDVATMTFPNPNDLTNFNVAITPQTGLWQGATYNFSFAIPADYPHTPPKITCNTRILHPNIDFQVRDTHRHIWSSCTRHLAMRWYQQL